MSQNSIAVLYLSLPHNRHFGHVTLCGKTYLFIVVDRFSYMMNKTPNTLSRIARRHAHCCEVLHNANITMTCDTHLRNTKRLKIIFGTSLKMKQLLEPGTHVILSWIVFTKSRALNNHLDVSWCCVIILIMMFTQRNTHDTRFVQCTKTRHVCLMQWQTPSCRWSAYRGPTGNCSNDLDVKRHGWPEKCIRVHMMWVPSNTRYISTPASKRSIRMV